MVAEIDRLRKDRDTIGGVFEVVAYGAPPGLGSYVHYDRKLDARLALALMSIQSVKGVEVGDGFATAGEAGIEGARRDRARATAGSTRATARAGGHRRRHEHRRADPGPSGHEAVLHRPEAAARPWTWRPASPRWPSSSAPTCVRCRRAGSWARPSSAFELANAVLEKFGGDSLGETADNLGRYLDGLTVEAKS